MDSALNQPTDEPAHPPGPDSVPAGDALQAIARLVEYRPGCFAALPPHTTYALIEAPEVGRVPGAAPYAHGVLAWQGMLLPLIDLNALLDSDASPIPAGLPRYALIVAYQSAPRRPLEYGAIGLDELPQTVTVVDAAHCELPGDSARWAQLAISCFHHAGQAVPILDTTRLFAAPHC